MENINTKSYQLNAATENQNLFRHPSFSNTCPSCGFGTCSVLIVHTPMASKRGGKRARSPFKVCDGRASKPSSSEAATTHCAGQPPRTCQDASAKHRRASAPPDTEPANSLRDNGLLPSLPSLDDLPEEDALLLREVMLLGHFHRKINDNALGGA